MELTHTITAAYDAEVWHDFAVAQAGAAAALTGLLFVAMSINLERILSFEGLPGRAAQTLALLVNVLLVSGFVLVPGQRDAFLGLEIVAVSGMIYAVVARAHLRAPTADPEWRRSYLATMAASHLAMLPYLICGLSLLVGWGGGLYWLIPGVAACFAVAVVNAWVLMIEILR